MFQLRHFLQHILNIRLTQTLMSCFLAKNQVPFEICAKTTFQIYFLKQYIQIYFIKENYDM